MLRGSGAATKAGAVRVLPARHASARFRARAAAFRHSVSLDIAPGLSPAFPGGSLDRTIPVRRDEVTLAAPEAQGAVRPKIAHYNSAATCGLAVVSSGNSMPRFSAL